jgi:hypothetical protein
MEEDWLKLEIQNGRQGALFGSFFSVKMTHLSIHHHSDYRTSPIVFILSDHVAMYDNMDEVWLKLEIQNGRQEAV